MKKRAEIESELTDKKARATAPNARLSDLSRRLLESDRKALQELFDELHVTLLRFCWRYTNDHDASRDVVQDVFIKVWEKRTTLDPDKSLLALMYTMVRNRALNLARNDRSSDRVDTSEITVQSSSKPDEQIDFKVLEGKIHQWIESLPPRRQEAFKLSRFEGLSHAEIAEIMNITPRTVNTHVMLTLRELRMKLEALHKDYQTDEQKT